MPREPKTVNVIRLFQQLLEGKYFTKQDVAATLGVAKKTADRYFAALQQAVELDYVEEDHGRRRWYLPATRRNFRPKLDRDDVLALQVALGMLEQYEGSYLADALATLREEIQQWWRSQRSDRDEADRWSAQKFFAVPFLPYRYREHGVVFEAVVAALAEERKLAFTYRPVRGAPSEKVVCPYTLVFHKGAFYLVARLDHVPEHYSPTTFMLARMQAAEVLWDAPYRYPRDWDPRAHFPAVEGIFPGRPVDVTLRFHPDYYAYLKEERDWPPGVQIRRGTEWVELRGPLVPSEELVHWVLGFGGEAEVIAPPELRERVAERARAAAARYAG